jgi:membrane protein YdbS with pleckstrin-like domain
MAQMFCTNCGQLIQRSNKFCPFCGFPQQSLEAVQQQPQAVQQQLNEHLSHGEIINHDDGNDTIEKRRLCDRALWSFFFSYLAKTGVVLLLLGVGFFVEPVMTSVAFVFYILFVYLVAVVVHRNYYFEVNGSSFRKEYGVLHKFDVTIPFTRIQNVNITRTLGDRMLGLARIDIETAGSSSPNRRNVSGIGSTYAEGHLPGVTMRQAQEVHDLLVKRFTELHTASSHRMG